MLRTFQPRPFRTLLQGAAVLALLIGAGCDEAKKTEDYLKNARASRAAGDISAAIADLKAALQKDPKDIEARILLAEYYLDLPDPIGAEALLWRARQDGAPDSTVVKPLAQAELLMGNPPLVLKTAELAADAPPAIRASVLAIKAEAFIALGRAQEAQDALTAGLELDPHSIDVLAGIARYALSSGNLGVAEARLAEAQAQAEAQKDEDARIDLLDLQGAVAFAAQDYPLSTSAYEKLLKAEPWNLNARLGLADTQIAEGKTTAAGTNLAAVLKVSPADPRANYLSALVAYRNNDYATAQARAQRALNAAKNFAPALLLAGASAYGLQQYEQANAFLSQFIYQVPQYVQARKLLAAVQIALGRPGDAVKTLAANVAGDSRDPQLYALIGAASAQTGDLAAADRYLRRALELQPENAALRTEWGIAQVALGQTDTGIDALEAASRQDPGMIRPDIALFVAYFKQQDYDKALEAAERLEKAHPTEATGFDFAGAAHLAKGNEAIARMALLKARELEPGDAIACRSLAALAIRRGDLAEAGQFYNEIINANPHDAAAYVSLADLLDQQGQRNDAVATLRRAIEQNPDAPAPRVSLGEFYLLDNNFQAALNAIEPLLGNNSKNPDILDIAGQAQLALGNLVAAVSVYKTLADLEPASARGHRGLASAYLAGGNLDLALAAANRAVDAEPKDQAAKLVLARILIATGGAENARAVLADLASRYPKEGFIAELQNGIALQQNRNDEAAERTRAALAQAKAGQSVEARAALSDWLDTHPDDIMPRKALGDIALAAGDLDSAEAQYEAILARDPGNAAAENNLAWVLSKKGDARAAMDHASRAANLAPATPRVLDTLGVVFLQNQRISEAVASLTKAAAAAPEDPGIQFHFAQALVGAGENARARALLKALLGSDRSFDERQQAQSLLQTLGG